MNLFIDNYNVGIKSLICPEYGPRHWEKAKTVHGFSRLAHRIIGAVECFPVLGHVVSLIEGIVHACFSSAHSSRHLLDVSSPIPHSPNSTPNSGHDSINFTIDSTNPETDPVLDACLMYHQEATLQKEMWYVPFLAFCLVGQPKALRDAIGDSESSSYELLQFIWIQWALENYQNTKNWDHLCVPDSLKQEKEKLETALHNIFKNYKLTDKDFKAFIFSTDQIELFLSEEKSLIDFFTNRSEQRMNGDVYLAIAKEGQKYLEQEFSQFTVVKEGLKQLFSSSSN